MLFLAILLLSCENKNNTRIPEEKVNLDQCYELTISSYQTGYLQGRLDQMKKQKNRETDYSVFIEAEVKTLEYIKVIKLDTKYYKLAKIKN